MAPCQLENQPSANGRTKGRAMQRACSLATCGLMSPAALPDGDKALVRLLRPELTRRSDQRRQQRPDHRSLQSSAGINGVSAANIGFYSV